MTQTMISVGLFLLAGLLEIAGGYLVWDLLGGLVCLAGVWLIMYAPHSAEIGVAP